MDITYTNGNTRMLCILAEKLKLMTYEEYINKLKAICDEKIYAFKFYDDEVEAEKKEGFVIQQDLAEKLLKAENELQESVFNCNTVIRDCAKNGINIETAVVPYQ